MINTIRYTRKVNLIFRQLRKSNKMLGKAAVLGMDNEKKDQTISRESLYLCLTYLREEANRAGFQFTAHLIEVAAEAALEESGDG